MRQWSVILGVHRDGSGPLLPKFAVTQLMNRALLYLRMFFRNYFSLELVSVSIRRRNFCGGGRDGKEILPLEQNSEKDGLNSFVAINTELFF